MQFISIDIGEREREIEKENGLLQRKTADTRLLKNWQGKCFSHGTVKNRYWVKVSRLP